MSAGIRNFCIIAHIDHGKSTLADRLLEITGTIGKREMQAQFLDQMDLERERGITIKLQPVTMNWQGYILNLIDTPGHVDFTYEVSRSLACVEGAILLVDATQGVQAQTIANLDLARAVGLTIIPVINKIDLPAADVASTAEQISELLGVPAASIHQVSGKTGQGVAEVLQAVIDQVPPPEAGDEQAARALIFDSHYDDYRGVIAAVRVTDGVFKAEMPYQLLGTKSKGTLLEVGQFIPQLKPTPALSAGAIGYVATGLKDIKQVRVGDTLASSKSPAKALAGYREVRPMVFAGFYPAGGEDIGDLREALGKLSLNDSSLIYEGEHSPALGFGFRCGFLGLLHLDVTRERLKREYKLEVTITTPSVAHEVKLKTGETLVIHSALELPTPDKVAEVQEPYVRVDIVSPPEYLGALMTVAQDFRGSYITTDYLGSGQEQARAILRYELPLNAILVDFYDKLKSVSAGYASLNYDFIGYRPCQVRRLDVLVADEAVEALSTIVYEDESYRRARVIAGKLKQVLPRQMFEIKIQVAIGGRILASERLPAMRKDVLKRASSGGDVTRKRKLLEKQKAGKKRMRLQGRVDIPPEAYLALVSREE
ncbi:MAG: Elongation factor 4 [Parcubacteria group bacterium GW2011_GWD2_43_10]|nr:MAG: Elongation factor 4 [Parcubacteria group bacterium GW2011_GWD2_43_10]KKS93591.1 MAG: Elongation factor 4 [Parcubacteria group bacterium GW2011_GWE2_43_12]HBZ36340.1 elongation factor 4 [Candidatus Veblenbacteria bacterium]